MPPVAPSYLTQWLAPVVDALQVGAGRPCLIGLHGSTPGFSLSLLTQGGPSNQLAARSWLVIAKDDDEADRLYRDTVFFRKLCGLPVQDLALFPQWEILPYESTAPPVDLVARRMQALHQLATASRTVLFTSVPAVIQRILPAEVFTTASLQFEPDGNVEREALVSGLLRLGYRQSSVVEIPGEFSLRGGIVDIFSTAYAEPLRIEFLGDTVESLRFFDPATQKSTDKIKQAWVLPAREFVRPPDAVDALKPLAADAEWHAPSLYGRMDTLLDYFPQPPLLALDQPDVLRDQTAVSWKAI
ncbi:MAG TPA: hypothetical protein VFQ34_11985, partial [Nitrospiraceae bacterium]|nr:hypothetical protein [Nitrospiraceae bacterium]